MSIIINKPRYVPIVPSLNFPLKNTLIPIKGIGVTTFTRSTTSTLTDFEGLLKTAKAGEIRFEGARRVENIVPSNVLTWGITASVSITSGVTDKDGGTGAYTVTRTSGASGYLAFLLQGRGIADGVPTQNSLWIRRRTGTGVVTMYNGSVASSTTVITSSLSSTWTRIATPISTGITASSFIGININVVGDQVDIQWGQSEAVIGQANKNPSEYVSKGALSAPYHGAGVDGVKYFTTQNGNTVASNVVTEATGSAISTATVKGARIEAASTNLCIQSEDFNTSWGRGGVGISAPVVTVNQAVSRAGTLTADLVSFSATTAINQQGHLFLSQGISTIGTTYTASIELKTITGEANIYIGLIENTGITGAIVRCAVTNEWKSFSVSRTAVSSSTLFLTIGCDTRTTVGQDVIQPASSVYVWGAQVEALPMATSYIPTTTATVTRNSDLLTFPNVGNVSNTQGTVLMDITPAFDIPNGNIGGYGSNYLMDYGTNNGHIYVVFNNIRRSDGTNLLSSPTWTPLKDTTYKIGSRYGSAGQRNWLNGNAGTNGAFDGSINSGTNMTIGGYGGNTASNWGGNIKNLKIYKKALADSKITTNTTITD